MKKFKNEHTIKFTAILLSIAMLFTMMPFGVFANELNNDFMMEKYYEILESGTTLMTFTTDESTGEFVHIASGTLFSEDTSEFFADSDEPRNVLATLDWIIARRAARLELTFIYFTNNPAFHGFSVIVSGTMRVDGHVGVPQNSPAHIVNQSQDFSTSVTLGVPRTINIDLPAHHINERLRGNVDWCWGSGTHDSIVNWGHITTNWHRGTFASVLASVNYHYIKHRREFAATNIVEFCNLIDMLFNEVNADRRNLTPAQFNAKYYRRRSPRGDGYDYSWRPTLNRTIRIHDTNRILTAWWN